MGLPEEGHRSRISHGEVCLSRHTAGSWNPELRPLAKGAFQRRAFDVFSPFSFHLSAFFPFFRHPSGMLLVPYRFPLPSKPVEASEWQKNEGRRMDGG